MGRVGVQPVGHVIIEQIYSVSRFERQHIVFLVAFAVN